MANKPEITKTFTEVNQCAYCGTPCWYQAVCSLCQVGMLIDVGEHKTWDFRYIVMWAKRLYNNVYQEVDILYADARPVDSINDKYTVMVTFIDGSKTEQYAQYTASLTKDQAERLAKKLIDDEEDHLNGLYWDVI